jgi:Uma2 family endonuclease
MQLVETLTEYELERGKPMPSKNHGLIQALLIATFFRFADRYTILSEVALDLEPNPLIPDISVYPRLAIDWVRDEIRMKTPPTLVVEILSPTQAIYELIEKIETYFAAGVQSCWLVQPTLKTIALFTPTMEPHVYTTGDVTDPATGITVNIEEIFRS